MSSITQDEKVLPRWYWPITTLSFAAFALCGAIVGHYLLGSYSLGAVVTVAVLLMYDALGVHQEGLVGPHAPRSHRVIWGVITVLSWTMLTLLVLGSSGLLSDMLSEPYRDMVLFTGLMGVAGATSLLLHFLNNHNGRISARCIKLILCLFIAQLLVRSFIDLI